MAKDTRKRKRVYRRILIGCGVYALLLCALAIIQRVAFSDTLYGVGLMFMYITFYPAILLAIVSGIGLFRLWYKGRRSVQEQPPD
jgi:hypothetical protein